MKRIFIILLLLINYTILANVDVIKMQYKSGLHFYNKQNYEMSISYLIDIVKNPQTANNIELRAKVYLLLGKNYNNLKQYQYAEFYLFQLFKNTPLNDYYLNGLFEIGKTYFLSGRFTKAIEVYDYIIEKYSAIKPITESMFLKGEAFLSSGNKDNAVKLFTKIVNNYKNSHRYNDALEKLKKLNPGDTTQSSTTDNSGSEQSSQTQTSTAQSGQQPQTQTTSPQSGQQTQTQTTAPQSGQQTQTQTTAPQSGQQTQSQSNTPQSGQQTQTQTTTPQSGQTAQTQTATQDDNRERSYYPSGQSFSDAIRTELLRSFPNLSENDLMKLESRLRLLDQKEKELTRAREELRAFHNLIRSKDKMLELKAKAVQKLYDELKKREQELIRIKNIAQEIEKQRARINEGTTQRQQP